MSASRSTQQIDPASVHSNHGGGGDDSSICPPDSTVGGETAYTFSPLVPGDPFAEGRAMEGLRRKKKRGWKTARDSARSRMSRYRVPGAW
jgi:hypothetical protein